MNKFTQKNIENIITIIYANYKLTASYVNMTFPLKKLQKIHQQFVDCVPEYKLSIVRTSIFIEEWIHFFHDLSPCENYFKISNNIYLFKGNPEEWVQFSKRFPELINNNN